MKDRREARPFEPPPWEADQYAELQKRKQEPPLVEPENAGSTNMGQAVAEIVVEQTKLGTSPAEDDGVRVQETNEAAVEAMLAQLAAEEPRTDESLIRAGTVAAVVFALVGAVIAVWGIAAIASAGKSGRVALAGGAGMLALGGLFFGAGVWVVVSNLRKRGFI